MNRRDFLSMRKTGPDTVEVSCERLFIHYRDALNAGEAEAFLRRASAEFAKARHLRLKDSHWLDEQKLSAAIQPLLAEHRATGGSVDLL
jgi:hypothetical protein